MTWSHSARVLDPSMAVAGKSEGARTGATHITNPRRRKPRALPKFIRAAH
jgi:hypothetical protein